MTAEAGALLGREARRRSAGLTGAEFAGGIPGSVGGAVFMNAGAYDGQMAGIVEQTEYLDETGALHTLTGEEHGFVTAARVPRPSGLTVVRSTLRLQQGDPAAILDKMNDLRRSGGGRSSRSISRLPARLSNARKDFCGRPIEDAG